jgi:hypothetical protein
MSETEEGDPRTRPVFQVVSIVLTLLGLGVRLFVKPSFPTEGLGSAAIDFTAWGVIPGAPVALVLALWRKRRKPGRTASTISPQP